METIQFLAAFTLGLICIFFAILLIEKLHEIREQKRVIKQTRQRIKDEFGI